MKDKLAEIFEIQAKLQKLHGHDFDNMTTEEKEAYTKDFVLYLLEETHELLRETNFKTYKKSRKPVDINKISEELIDVGAFLFDICLAWGLTAEDFHKKFLEKSKKNLSRVHDKTY